MEIERTQGNPMGWVTTIALLALVLSSGGAPADPGHTPLPDPAVSTVYPRPQGGLHIVLGSRGEVVWYGAGGFSAAVPAGP